MKATRTLALIAVVLATALGSGRRTTEAGEAGTAGIKAFVGARLFDGTGASPIPNAVILVRDGKIEAVGPASAVPVPAGAERIDLASKHVVPGVINSHGHVGQTRGLDSSPAAYTVENLLAQLGLYARYGVTTVFSLGGDGPAAVTFRNAQDTADLDRARLYLAGPVITGATPDAARAMVREAIALPADLIKIRVDDNLGTTPKLPPAVYQAIIEEAHRGNRRVAAHIFYLDDAKGLLKAGVDVLAHSVRDKEVDGELIGLMKTRDVCLCPTLSREVSAFIYDGTPEFFKDPFLLRDVDPKVLAELGEPERQKAVRNAAAYRHALEVASLNVKKLQAAGVRIAFGTDSGPAGRFQGYFEHMEMELMAKAGLTPKEILLSATADAARCMKVSDRLGTLEKGKWADFLVLGADPLTDIKNMRKLESVWISGNRVPPRKGPQS